MCIIKSLKGDHTGHDKATMGMHTGSFNFARPSIGSWVSYGLGTENQNLPSCCHQGTHVLPGTTPIPNIARRSASDDLQQMELELLAKLNQRHLTERPEDQALEARIKSFETAFGMQHEAPEALDLSRETDETLALYGMQRGATTGFGWQCLVARRMAERGVRFIELIDTGSGSGGNWDSHGDMNAHAPLAKALDQPVAGLLTDLKRRGLLDSTLVVWTTEFGRTPYNTSADAKGREHHHQVFSSWLAGGGVQGGITYGESDDYGVDVGSDQVHVHDFHATILHLLGLDHEKLTYRFSGRDYRLTDVAGRVVKEVLA
jgi:hypothetical protein